MTSTGIATAARHAGGRPEADKAKIFDGEIISSTPHADRSSGLTTVTAVVHELMPKGSVLRIQWENQSFNVDMNKAVPAGMQITMHVPSATSEMGLTGHQRGTEFQALAARAPLVKAAAAGNWPKVKKLVKKGNNVDVIDHEGKTALWHACAAGHKETVKLLLKAKAKVDYADAATMTPLMRAVVSDQCEIVEMLLAAGADIDYTDHNDVTALIFGAGTDSLAAVRVLLEHGCNLDQLTVNKADRGEGEQLSALMLAARQGKVEMLRQIVEFGADLDLCSCTNGWGAFHMACAEGDGEMVAILVKAGCNTALKDVLGRTGKDCAEENAKHDIVSQLRSLVVARMREQLIEQGKTQLADRVEGRASDERDDAATAAAAKLLSNSVEPESQRGSALLVGGGGGGGGGFSSWLVKGSHVVVDDGRFGVVMSEPLSSGKVILRLPDGSETLYIHASKLRLGVEEIDYCYRSFQEHLSYGLKGLITDRQAAGLAAEERLTGKKQPGEQTLKSDRTNTCTNKE